MRITRKHGRDVVEGGSARTRRYVARCIGGISADHTDVKEAKRKRESGPTKAVMWRRERVRADGLEHMRHKIREARRGATRVEIDGYGGRGCTNGETGNATDEERARDEQDGYAGDEDDEDDGRFDEMTEATREDELEIEEWEEAMADDLEARSRWWPARDKFGDG